MSSRLTTTPTLWLLALAGAATLAIALYSARQSNLDEAKANQQVARAREAIVLLRQEHAELRQQLRLIQVSARSIAEQAEAMQRREELRRPERAPVAQLAPHRPASPAGSVEVEKEQAWKSYFRPLKGCEVWRDDQHMVECQNLAIRAKREFEERWRNGELGAPAGTPGGASTRF